METVQYGTKTIDFLLKRSDRKTLGIEVHPDLSVWVIAPEKSSLDDIKENLLKKAKWISKQQNFFSQFLPRTPERQYVSGETHLYLGRRYILRVRKSSEDSVKLKGGELIVYYKKNNSKDHVKELLTGWYYNHASVRFKKEIEKSLSKFNGRIKAKPTVEIRRMKNRWGSCTPKGKIIINPELIKAPTKCIDYVLIHELSHLVHPNHSKEFYQLQSSLLPNWQKWKEKLELVMG